MKHHYFPERLHTRLEKTIDRTPSRFGYELLRDHVLPNILGQHEEDILYWAGKEVARKFPVFTIEELPTFFSEAGWGKLSLYKTSKDDVFYYLQDEPNILNVRNRTFSLEAGFIAEQYQKINGLPDRMFW